MATPTEVSQQLDIPPATLRRYVSVFGQHLSAEARLPRGRQFSEADLETLARIRALLSDGSSMEEVVTALGGSDLAQSEPARPESTSEPATPVTATSESDSEAGSIAQEGTDREPEPTAAAQTAPAMPRAPDRPRPAVTAQSAPELDGDDDETVEAPGEAAEFDAEEAPPRWRSYARVQPVRSSREARKMVAELGGVDHLSQRLALAEDRLLTSNERMAVLEARIARLEEWLRMPWYRRLLAKPPDYDL